MNIVSEMCTNQYQHECVDMDEDHIVLIINIGDHQKKIWQAKIKALF